jgi:N-acetylneuraminate lyase
MQAIHGVIPALITPLHPDGSLNEDTLAQLISRLYLAGCHGLYVAGSTGEGLLLSLPLRKQLAEAVMRLSPPGKATIIHVGTLNTPDAIRLAKHAAALGATAISSLPPAGPYGFAELRGYYQSLAAESPLPLLIYFFPELAPAIRGYAQLAELCSLPNVIGLKFTDFDFYTLARVKKLGSLVFNGRDEALACGMLMGADGGIGSFYNIAPELFVSLYAAARSGDWTEVQKQQARINELIAIVLAYPLFPALKQILAWQGLDCGVCVAPRLPLTDSQQRQLRIELENAGFLA